MIELINMLVEPLALSIISHCPHIITIKLKVVCSVWCVCTFIFCKQGIHKERNTKAGRFPSVIHTQTHVGESISWLRQRKPNNKIFNKYSRLTRKHQNIPTSSLTRGILTIILLCNISNKC